MFHISESYLPHLSSQLLDIFACIEVAHLTWLLLQTAKILQRYIDYTVV